MIQGRLPLVQVGLRGRGLRAVLQRIRGLLPSKPPGVFWRTGLVILLFLRLLFLLIDVFLVVSRLLGRIFGLVQRVQFV